MARSLIAAAFAAATALSAAALDAQSPAPIKFARYAHVANDGRIAFTYADDIWVAEQDGSNPRRLTAHVARGGAVLLTSHAPLASPVLTPFEMAGA